MTAVAVHVMGTLALVAVSLAVIVLFQNITSYYGLEAERVQLSEAVEALGRGLVEAVALHTMGESNITLLEVKLPPDISGKGYTVELRGGDGEAVELVGRVVGVSLAEVVVLPNFGEGVVEPVNESLELTCGSHVITVRSRVTMPSRGAVYVAVLRAGDAQLVGFIQERLGREEVEAISSGACSWGG
ncbi:MAG: hypothetical protein DRJ67_12005 [Thermoprotei archaeon]|nr:MAG: hypothetical protein DRJ67_12005 [Thermoprotei archaeon]